MGQVIHLRHVSEDEIAQLFKGYDDDELRMLRNMSLANERTARAIAFLYSTTGMLLSFVFGLLIGVSA